MSTRASHLRRSIGTVLSLLAIVGPSKHQEPARPVAYTIKEKGTFLSLVNTLSRTSNSRIRVTPDVPERELAIDFQNLTYFEALDALCRAHGSATYLFDNEDIPPSEDLTIAPANWIEYPSTYCGHFKFIIRYALRAKSRSVYGTSDGVKISLALIAPPWVRVTGTSGTTAQWSMTEMRAIDKRGLLAEDIRGGAGHFLKFFGEPLQRGNVTVATLCVTDFDLAKGLEILSGRVKLTWARSSVVRVPLKAGKEVRVQGGTITVKSMTALEKIASRVVWRVACEFTPLDDRSQLASNPSSHFEECVRYEEGTGEWGAVHFRWRGSAFEFDSDPLAVAPTFVDLRVRGKEETLDLPFSFREVKFK